MKILVVGRTLPTEKTGSYGLFEYEQAKALAKQEKTGYLFLENSSLLTNRKIQRSSLVYRGIPVVGFYLPIKGLPKKLYNYIKSKIFIQAYKDFIDNYWEPDVIHIHFPLLTTNHRIINFLKLQNVKIIVTEHWSKVQKKELSKEKIKLLNYISRNVGSFICVSDLLRQSVLEMTDIKKEKTIVVPNIISSVFDEKKHTNIHGSDKFIFTFIGMLTKNKRVDLLIKAFLKAFENNHNVKLLIIGDGSQRSKLEKMSDSELGNIKFVGLKSKKEIVNYLSRTSVYVSASNLETFGVPFIESMSMGIPIIGASNLPIKKYISEHNGILFAVDNETDLVEKLKYMYHNIDKFNEQKIKKDIKNKFSEEKVVKKLISVYKEID